MSDPSAPATCTNCGLPVTAATAVCPRCGKPAPAAPMGAVPWQAAPPRPVATAWLLPVLLSATILFLAVAVAGVLFFRPAWLPGSSSPGAETTTNAASPAPATSAASGPSAAGRAPTTAATKAPSRSGGGATTSHVDVLVGPLNSHVRAKASTTSTASHDGFGNTTHYDARNVLDLDPSTCWRADGNATSVRLTFSLDRARPISVLGLINGYAKTDLATGEDRYYQERRVLQVTWTLAGQSYHQQLQDDSEQLQQFSLTKPVTAAKVQLRIDQVTSPGDPRFDRTPISDVLIAYQ